MIRASWRTALVVGASLAIAVAVMAGSTVASGASTCVPVEYVNMYDPVVTVVEGPADGLEAEQALWSAVKRPQLEAPNGIVLDNATFTLERSDHEDTN